MPPCASGEDVSHLCFIYLLRDYYPCPMRGLQEANGEEHTSTVTVTTRDGFSFTFVQVQVFVFVFGSC